MRNYSVFFLTVFILTSCDGVENFAAETMKSKTMKGYLQCMKNNDEEVSFFGYTYVRDECAKKHSKQSNKSSHFTECRAFIETGSNPSIEIDTCNNKTDSVVTSLKVGIIVKNIPLEPYLSITSEHKSMFVKPSQNIEAKISINSSKLNDYQNLPFCTDEPEEICKTWFISEYSYIPANIN